MSSTTGHQVHLVWASGALCIYAWDWILCLPDEYQQIWKKKFTPISALYLVNRYFGFLQFPVVVSLMSGVWSPAACRRMSYWDPAGGLITVVLSQMILGIRVYGVLLAFLALSCQTLRQSLIYQIYAQSRMVAILLCSILLVEVGLGAITVSLASPPTPDATGAIPLCAAVPASLGWMTSFWTIPLFYDIIVFLLTAWKTYGFWRSDTPAPLIALIWRDGLFYVFAISTMNGINVIIFFISPHSLIWVINLTPTLMFTVILSCRLVLNLRKSLGMTASRAADSGRRMLNNRTEINHIASPYYHHHHDMNNSHQDHDRRTPHDKTFVPGPAAWAAISLPVPVKLDSGHDSYHGDRHNGRRV